jgi:predicted RND superfamily exporter protein
MRTEPAPLAQRYAAAIDRWRWPIVVLSLLVTAVAGWLAEQLPLYGDFSYLLPQTAPSVMQLRELEKRVKNLGTLMVAVESKDEKARAGAAADLRDRLKQIDHGLVAEVQFDDGPARRFVWEHRWLYVDLPDLQAARDALADKITKAKLAANPLYVSLDDEDDAAQARGQGDQTQRLRAKLDEAESKKDAEGFVSKDRSIQLIVLRTTFEAGAASKGAETVAAVERAAAETQKAYPVVIGITGDVVSGLVEHDALVNGILQAAILTSLIVAVGLILYYRSLRAVAALLWALAVGTAMTFGFTRLAIGHLNIASGFLSSIVIGNGINFGIIVLARHLEERRHGLRGVDAIANALGGTLTGTLAAALTATVAYGSLVTTGFKGFRHFGVIGGVGMGLCWIAAYTVLPALLAILERRGLSSRHEPVVGRVLARLMPHTRRGAAIVASVALTVTAAAGYATYLYMQNPYEGNFRNLRSSSAAIDKTREWLGRIDDAFGRNISGGFVIAVPTRAQATEVTKRLRAVDAGKPAKDQLLGGIRSIDDVLPADQEQKLTLLADLRRMIDHESDKLGDADRADLGKLRPPEGLHVLTDGDLPEQMAWPFSEKDGSRGKIILADASLAYDTWLSHDLLEFTGKVQALNLGDDVILGGANFVFADVIRSMEGDGPKSTAIALVGALLVIALLVGAGRHGLITLVCMASGTLLMLAGAWLMGLRVNFLDFVALPITIGIGIDYSVNIVARARREGFGSARHVLETTGGAVALCSFTTVVGYGSLLLSVNQGIRSFGLAAILGEFTCITAALILAPTLLTLLVRPRLAVAPAGVPVLAAATSVAADDPANSNEKSTSASAHSA